MQDPLNLPLRVAGEPFRRAADDIRAMAIAVQANLVQLKVADAKRRGLRSIDHEIMIRPPGAVLRYRDTLIDRKILAGYGNDELQMRLHEIWGRFCLFQWLFLTDEGRGPCDFGTLPEDVELRCDTALSAKHTELHAIAWRILFEQRWRDAKAGQAAPSEADTRWAETIPASAFGRPITECDDREVVLAACEHVGMLAVLRWVMEASRRWDDPDLMMVADQPFPT